MVIWDDFEESFDEDEDQANMTRMEDIHSNFDKEYVDEEI